MATSMISKDYVFETISFPSVSITASGIGTYATSATVNVAKTGYSPIGIAMNEIGHPASYNVAVSLIGNSAMAFFYRTTSAAYTVPNGDITATVIYKKS